MSCGRDNGAGDGLRVVANALVFGDDSMTRQDPTRARGCRLVRARACGCGCLRATRVPETRTILKAPRFCALIPRNDPARGRGCRLVGPRACGCGYLHTTRVPRTRTLLKAPHMGRVG